MLMPNLQNRLQVEYYLGTDLIQFSHRKTMFAAQRQGCEPVIADLVLTLNVYVLGLVESVILTLMGARTGRQAALRQDDNRSKW